VAGECLAGILASISLLPKESGQRLRPKASLEQVAIMPVGSKLADDPKNDPQSHEHPKGAAQKSNLRGPYRLWV